MSPDGPPSRRRVTFRNPEAELSSERDTRDYSTEPSVSDVETWAGMAGQTAGHPCLVDRTPSHSGYKRPLEACLEN